MAARQIDGLIQGFRGVRAALTQAVLELPADACFRGSESSLLDLTWSLTLPAIEEEWLAQLLAVEPADLGPVPGWEERRQRLLRRYYHAVEVLIEFLETLQPADLERRGSRGGKPDTLGDALGRSLEHDIDYLGRLRNEYTPRVLALPELPEPRGPEGIATTLAGIELERRSAAEELEVLADRLPGMLAAVDYRKAFEGADPTVADLMLHCSNKPALLEVTRRMLTEDEPELGTLASPAGFWQALPGMVAAKLRARARRWRELDGALLKRTGQLAGRPFSVTMAIAAELDHYRAAFATIEARMKPQRHRDRGD